MMPRKGRKPFVSDAERIFKRLVPQAVYADKPYYDFMIPRYPRPDKPPYYLKIEVARIFSGRKKGDRLPKIKLTIRKGTWTKSQGIPAHFLVALGFTEGVDRIYYGPIGVIADNVHSILPGNLRAESFSRYVPFHHAPKKLEQAGVMRSLPVREAHKLVKLLQEAEYKMRQQKQSSN